MAGARLNHVPYKGGGPALNDLVGGHVKFFFSNASASTPFVKAGKLRAIAHTGRGRLAPNSPAEFAAFVAAETDRWAKVIREANIKLE